MKQRIMHTFRMAVFALVLVLALHQAFVFGAGEKDVGSFHKGGGSPVVAAINIDISGGAGDAARWTSMARGMIFMEEGKPFSEEQLLKSLAALKDAKMFARIHVPDPDRTNQGLVFNFQLTPFPRIRAIRIDGAFPVFEREVRNALSFHSGGRYAATRIPAEEASVVELFKRQGYVAPEVRIAAEPGGEEGVVDLRVRIDKGRYFRIKHFAIEGNQAFSDFRLKLRTDTWKKSLLFGDIQRFVPKDLDQDVKGLVKFYRAKDYADVSISADVQKDPADASVIIRLAVNEGRRYEVAFEGNDAYWAWWTLRKELVLENGNRNDAGLKKSLRNVRQRYRNDGYLDSEVTVAESSGKKSPKNTREIRIMIDEGPQYIVEKMKIRGNEVFDDAEIQDQMLTRTPGIFADGAYNPKQLKDDIGAIKALYLKDGYRKTAVERAMEWQAKAAGEAGDAAVPKPPKKAAAADSGKTGGGKRYGDLTLTIAEGVQTRVAKLSVTGVSAVPVDTVRAAVQLKPGAPYREYLLANDEDTITGIIAEKGFPYVRVTGKAAVNAAGTGAEVIYTVSEGRYVEMGGVYFTGNFMTAEQILRNEMEIGRGEPFSARKILESQRNIQNMEAIDQAQFRLVGLQEDARAPTLFMDIEERRPYWLEMSLGYDTERHLFGALKGGNRNLFGRNNDLRGSLEVSQIGYRADASFTEPRFRQSRISSTSTLFAERIEEFNQDFGTRSFGVSQNFSRNFLQNDLNLGLAFRLERREQYMRDDKPIPPGDEDLYIPRTVFVTTPTAVYNTTDSFTRPTKGIYSSLFVDISTGLQESLDNFVKYRFETRYYTTPVERLTFALRGRYGYIYPYGTDSVIPDDQLFYLGGTSTVRGFDENLLRFDADGKAVGGREAVLGNAEVRYDLGMNIEMAVFYDIGSVARAEGRGGSDGFRSSTGVGLRYITPIGAVGLLYGWKIDPLPNEDAGRLHFSIGYTF